MSATSRACRARGIWRTIRRHTDKRAVQYTAPDRRPTNQVSFVTSWTGEVARHADIRGLRVSAKMSRGRFDETASVEIKLNGDDNAVTGAEVRRATVRR